LHQRQEPLTVWGTGVREVGRPIKSKVQTGLTGHKLGNIVGKKEAAVTREAEPVKSGPSTSWGDRKTTLSGEHMA